MLDLPLWVIGGGSFLLLVLASWCVGEGGEILGKKYDASIIGGLVIAWLNTAPEAIFFITALNSDNPRFAVGAVSGSSVVVCTVALGACLWIGASARKNANIVLQPAVKKQCTILGTSTLVTAIIAATGFSTLLGVVAVGFYLWFMYYSLQHKEVEEHESKHDEELGGIEIEEEEEDVSTLKGVGYLITGGVLIVVFSSPFINSVVQAASILDVNPILLAFFLAPVASEAPEILESISLSRKGNSQSINIAYSNLVGGTITKTTLLVGILCFFGVSKGFTWEVPSYPLSLALLIVCAGSAAAIGAAFATQTKWHGMCLFVLFVITGCIQYTTNTHFEGEIFMDEGVGHDDVHHLITSGAAFATVP
jgi:cation:H+ antiporter